MFSSCATRLEKMSPSMNCACASAEKRGSRLIGANSIKKFTVPGAGSREEPLQLERMNVATSKVAMATIDNDLGVFSAPLRLCGWTLSFKGFPSAREWPDDFAHHDGARCSRCRRYIVWTPVPRLIGQHCKCESFFGIFGHAESAGWKELNPWERGRELGHNERIVRPAASDDHFSHMRAWQNEFLKRVCDGERRKYCCRPHQIRRFDVVLLAKRENPLGGCFAELLAAGGFRRLFLEIVIAHQAVEQPGQCPARHRDLRILVVMLAALRNRLDERIDDHVAGSGVECEDVRVGCIRGDYGYIRNSADIQCNAADMFAAVEQIVDEWHERRALAANGHVRRAKIRDDRNAGLCRDYTGLADLQG